MKRLFATLLIILFSLSTALASSPSERLSQLDIISQKDDRFRELRYCYNGKMFFERGCLPSSMYNALMALLGTPNSSGDALLEELLNECTEPFQRYTSSVSPDYLSDMLKYPEPGSATAALVADLDEILTWNALTDATTTLQAIQDANGRSLLLIEKLSIFDNWEQLCHLVLQLNAAGYRDAQLAFGSVVAGYGSLDEAPFGSGQYGHYIALYLEVEEFCRTGAFYLLDSLPRALLYEPYGYDSIYQDRYAFTLRLNDFKRFFNPERITPCVVRFSLHDEQQQELDQLLNDASLTDDVRLAKLTALHKRHMNTVFVLGIGQALLYIP